MSERDELPAALRRDVRLLSTMLGQILTEAVGEDLLADVEQLRTLAISGEIEQAEEVVAGWTDERAEQVARAFTAYFHLANLAEEQHRLRVLAERDASGTAHDADSYPAAWSDLVSEVGKEEADRRLAGLEFRPVFTAHPTEARRRAVASAIRRISALLARRDDPRVRGRNADDLDRQLLAEIDLLWRTAPLRSTKPSPTDEVRTAMSIFDNTLFEVVPKIYRTLDATVLGERTGTAAPVAPAFLRLGCWIGGDRDGNPHVTAKVTRQAARIASDHVLRGLENATLRIGRSLTAAQTDAPASKELKALLRAQSGLAEELATEIAERSPEEPHRQALLFFVERLQATRLRNADLAYADAEEFLAELRTVQDSLSTHDPRSAWGSVQDLIWQTETFGFHLAEFEIRQHSKVHRQALEELDAGVEPSEMTIEVLDTLRVLGRIQKRFGTSAARRYIISFTQSADDLAAVIRLAEYAFEGEELPVIDVIPLFETYDDLQASTGILDELITMPHTRQRLAENGRRLEVMLGYSDSSKDVGPVSATLALYDAQARIASWAQANDIALTLFHGRGGALGRGGGPANQAVLAQPPGSVEGRFKLTEQGEVIFARYGDQTIAQRHVEQVSSATLRQGAPSISKRNADSAERFAPMAETMDRASRTRFYDLVKSEGFAPWFAQVTPQEEVGWLSLGSRPARRGLSVESLEDLRAIPWVFAWSQARINLTGWFGLGTALAAVGEETELRAAFAQWPLFSAMIENVEMSLAKTDDRIAERYLALGDRDDLAGLVREEMALTREWVARTTGKELLTDRPVLRRAVELRSPYVDALSLLQLRALRRLRTEEGADDAAARRLMLLAVSGVSAGLQNTG
ncbi:phosphoenolpyruvate carboxylase [Naumannella halotolerans]|nr:phosphoenolpyruvate carboxylase [Naumannella halotolerans]